MPDRPCDHAAAARGSFEALYGQSTKDFGSFFNWGRLRHFVTDRGVWLFRATRVCRGRRARFNLAISVATTSEERMASGCCGHRGHPGHVGVEFAATKPLGQRRAHVALSNTAGSCIGTTSAAVPSPVVASSAWAAVNILGSSRRRRCRAALGVVRSAGAIAGFLI